MENGTGIQILGNSALIDTGMPILLGYLSWQNKEI